jgi:hypothetical protein
MKLQHITELLARANAPTLSREELMGLVGTDEGRRFHAALTAFDAGEVDQAGEIRRIVSTVLDVSSTRPKSATRHASPPAQDPATGVRAPPPYFSFHVYGRAAALCISEARTRSNDTHTIQIDAAPALASGAKRTYDWPNKIIVQLSEQELVQALAFFEGKIDGLSLKDHGRAHDKFVRMERQEGHFFVEVGQKGRPIIGVPAGAPDAFKIVSLAYKQILANGPHLELAMIREMIAQIAAMHRPNAIAWPVRTAKP